MYELEFTTEVSNWINEIISQNPDLPFSRAKCEQHKKGSIKRRDLTLLDQDQRVILTGEVKLPYQKDGSSPYNSTVVNDARNKAVQAGSHWFFTWNINEFVLWETFSTATSWRDRNYESWEVTSVHNELHLESPITNRAIKSWLSFFIREYAKILHGIAKIGYKSPDEKFIDILEASLHMPIILNIAELDSLYRTGYCQHNCVNFL